MWRDPTVGNPSWSREKNQYPYRENSNFFNTLTGGTSPFDRINIGMVDELTAAKYAIPTTNYHTAEHTAT